RTRLRADISASIYSDADRNRHLMTATRMTRRKATPRPRRSSPSGDPARLVPFHPPPKQPPSHGSTLFPALQTHPPTTPFGHPANCFPQNRPSLPCPSRLIPHSPLHCQRSHSRDFVPWRFSYACRRRAWIRSSRRRPKTLYGVIFVKGVPGGGLSIYFDSSFF